MWCRPWRASHECKEQTKISTCNSPCRVRENQTVGYCTYTGWKTGFIENGKYMTPLSTWHFVRAAAGMLGQLICRLSMRGNKWLWYSRFSSLWGNRRLPHEQLTSALSAIRLLRFHKGKWSTGCLPLLLFEWQPDLVLTGVQETQTPHLFCSRLCVKRLGK